MEVKKIHEISKSNSSYGKWVVIVTAEHPDRDWLKETQEYLYYWTKKEALALQVGDIVIMRI